MTKRIVLGIVSLLSACAPAYVYKPDENATASIRGRTAAFYQIPPAAPRGDVRIASFGITDITLPGAAAKAVVRAMHLRLVVDNNSDQSWSIDSRLQRIAIAGEGESTPAYGAAEGAGPLVQIPPAAKRHVDLFFPLPARMQRAGKIPRFDAIWQVATPTGVVKERTEFERLRVEPTADDYVTAQEAAYYGWGGSVGWYNPFYATDGFMNPYALPPEYAGARVVIGAPGWQWHRRDFDDDDREGR